MKKNKGPVRKLTLTRETLSELVNVQGGSYTSGTQGQSAVVSNCYLFTQNCNPRINPMCGPIE